MRIGRNRALRTLIGVGMLVLATAVYSATRLARLSELSGTVLVTQGERFVHAREGMLIRPGERVITLRGARVTLGYESLRRSADGDRGDACLLTLEENSMVAIVDGDVCSHSVVSAADEIIARPPPPPVAAKPPGWPADEPLVRCTFDNCLQTVTGAR